MNDRTPPILLTPAPSTAHDHMPEADSLPITQSAKGEAPASPRLDPTRYGDWELNGKCVDF